MRCDYDAIAEAYDRQPIRIKAPDSRWLALCDSQHGRSLAMLDLSCGGGRQLKSNAAARSGHRYIGIDPSAGMIAVARRASPELEWHQAPAEALPLADASVDYISWQFAHHHAVDPGRCWSEMGRVLKTGGIATIENIHPEAMPDWPLYRFFPGCRRRDVEDFPSQDALLDLAKGAKLITDEPVVRHYSARRPLTELRASWSDRRSCSQLMTISEISWHEGLAELDRIIAADSGSTIDDQVALITLHCTKPAAVG